METVDLQREASEALQSSSQAASWHTLGRSVVLDLFKKKEREKKRKEKILKRRRIPHTGDNPSVTGDVSLIRKIQEYEPEGAAEIRAIGVACEQKTFCRMSELLLKPFSPSPCKLNNTFHI